MKPLHLRIQNFGSVVGTKEVSFLPGWSSGLFLIHGRTGSGKTTLLDALCFALFGKPSVVERERDLKTLRSDLAAADSATEVELIFKMGRRIFRIKRRPGQVLLNNKTQRLSESKAQATLEEGRGLALEPEKAVQENLRFDSECWLPRASQVKEVDQLIELTLGMDENQFRQIVILPQGRFRDFLAATSTERQEILEKIFQTERFRTFQSFLFQQAKCAEANYIEVSNKIKNLLNLEDVNTQSELQVKLAQITELQLTNDKHLNSVKLELETSEKQLVELKTVNDLLLQTVATEATYKKNKDQLQAHANKNRLVKVYKALRPALAWERTLAENNRRLQDVKTQIQTAQQQLALNFENQKSQMLLQPKLTELEEKKNSLKDLYRQAQELQKTKDGIELLKKQISEVSLPQKLEQMSTKLSLLLVSRAAYQDSIETSIKHLELKTQETRQSKHHVLATIRSEIHNGLHQHCPVCEQRINRELALSLGGNPQNINLATHKEIDIEKIESEIQRLTAQAARVDIEFQNFQNQFPTASSSIDKPYPVQSFEFKLLEFKSLMAEFANQQERVVRLQSHLDQQQERHDDLIEMISHLWKQVRNSSDDSVVPTMALIVQRGTEAGIEIDKRKKLESETIERVQKTEIVLARLSTESLEIESRIEQATASLTEEEALVRVSLADEISALQKDQSGPIELLELFTEAEIAWVKNLDLNELNNWDQTRQRLEQQNLELERLRSELDLKLKSLLSAEASVQEVDQELSKLQFRIQQLKLAADSALAASVRAESQRARISQVLSTISEYANEAIAIEKEHQKKQQLHLLVSGDRKVTARGIPLARFVLQSRFDQCLQFANQRLQKMSDGQYTLRRHDLSRGLNQSLGLNIAIDDSHSGKPRPADTLSGGESFIASLALALGLSDSIQYSLGGIEIDSLFIDEGFGTLDPETLDRALSSLLQLKSGGRLVGIISHVNELRNRIPTQLAISKGANGTTMKWENSSYDSNVSN